jgi:hypothetical protein
MRRWARRLVWLAVLTAVTAATARWWSTRSVPAPTASPSWPPFDPPAPGPRPVIVPQVSDEPLPPARGIIETVEPDGSAWVAPVEGDCPLDHPVKANDNSGIFHVPGGRFYDRTKAERCYVDAESATADGYRAAKA